MKCPRCGHDPVTITLSFVPPDYWRCEWCGARGVIPMNEELLGLAKKAVEACERRKGEDVKAWAEKLAADVADAND